MIRGNVLVTGGTGTLGRALVARAVRENWDCAFTIYSRDEMKQQAMKRQFPNCRYVLGDVADYDTLERVMVGHQGVLHLAAFKHIPAGEMNLAALYSTNLTGSLNVVKAALRTGVEWCLGISTDKACHPVNAYGMTKALMERFFQEANRAEVTRFQLVRYGNVLDSTGSVIPAWRGQAERGEPLKVTDPAMTRFWLSVAQAVDGITAALELPPGVVLIPMLRGLRMYHFAGYLFPGQPQVTTGLRPGEKRHEELLTIEESRFAETCGNRFHLYPVTDTPLSESGLTHGYTSDCAPQLTRAELLAMLDGCAIAGTGIPASKGHNQE